MENLEKELRKAFRDKAMSKHDLSESIEKLEKELHYTFRNKELLKAQY